MALEDRGPELTATAMAILVVASIAVLLRCYVKIVMLKAFKVEDWLAISTLTVFVAFCACVLDSVTWGAGKHVPDVSLQDISLALRARYIGELTYVVTSVLLKFTVAIFLLRICSTTWQRVSIWVTMILVLVFNLFYLFMAAFQCHPVSYFWEQVLGTAGGWCVSKQLIEGSTYASAGLNAIAEWYLGLLPFVLVRNLGLDRRSKISVAAILALGCIASAATIVRIPYTWQLTTDVDPLYTFVDLAIWSTVELGLGLMASSFATLRPLFKRFLATTQSMRSQTNRSGGMSIPQLSRNRALTPTTHIGTKHGDVEEEQIRIVSLTPSLLRDRHSDRGIQEEAPWSNDIHDRIDQWRSVSRASAV